MANGQGFVKKWPIAQPVALFGFSFQLSAFQLLPGCGFGWLARCPAPISAFYFVLSAFAWRWLVRAIRCWMLDVRCWMFGIHHKHPKYNSSLPPPSGWSGGTLVPPWTYPGTIDPLPDLLFNQARLFTSVSSGLSVAQPYLGLDVGCSVLDVRFPSLAVRDSQLAFGVRHRPDILELQSFTACSLGVG